MNILSSASQSSDYTGLQLAYQDDIVARLDECSILAQMEAEEEKRLLEEWDKTIALDEDLEYDENTDWLRGCGWPKWFANRPLHLVAAAAVSPSFDTRKNLRLGIWNGLECISPAASERVFWKLLHATDKVFVRREETLAQTPSILHTGHMQGGYASSVPLVAGIEVKQAGRDGDEGLAQLAVWAAAGLGRAEELSALRREQTRQESTYGLGLLLPLVGLVVVGHS